MLLDGYQILTEHALLTETLFVCLIMAAAILVMRSSVSWSAAAVAGGLLAYAALTRTVALPLVVLFVAYLCIRRVGWKPVVAFMVAFSTPLIAYAAWYSSFASNDFALQRDGRFLYARVAPFADCERMRTTPDMALLCDPALPETRPSPNFYAWDAKSPLATADFGEGVDPQEVARAFAVEAIRSQPLDYVRTVVGDTVQHFQVGRTYGRLDTPPSWWNFPEVPAKAGQQLALSGSGFRNDLVTVELDERGAEFLRGWQRGLGTQGPILLAGLLLAGIGAVWGVSRPEGGVRRADTVLLAGIGLGLLTLSSATSVFDYRYGIPAAPFLYLAGGVAVLLLRQRRPLGAAPKVAVTARGASSRRRVDRPWLGHPRTRVLVRAGAFSLIVALVALAPVREYPIYSKFVATGAERGVLGYPTSEEQPMEAGPSGWRERRFDGGTIFQSLKPFTYVVTGAAATAYLAPNLRESLGPPRSGTVPLGTGVATGEAETGERARATWFSEGALVEPLDGGLFSVRPPLLASWCEPRKRCALGVPVADAETSASGVVIQQFERGVLIKRPGEAVQRILIADTRTSSPRDVVVDDSREAGAQ
jgi:hypothetical protein